jgi:hypothetical protein
VQQKETIDKVMFRVQSVSGVGAALGHVMLNIGKAGNAAVTLHDPDGRQLLLFESP